MTVLDLAGMPSEIARRDRAEPVAKKRTRGSSAQMRNRIRVALAVFTLAYLVIAGRLIMFGLAPPASGDGFAGDDAIATSRPNLVDRNGEILATDIMGASVYAEPRNILDPDEATELLTSVLPGLDASALRKKLSSNAGFAWVQREITPRQEDQIHSLGIPGIGFMRENRRYYPGGATASHILGLVNIDNQGIAGTEKYVDDHWLSALHGAGFARGEDLAPVKLSIDLRVQHIVRDELADALVRYKAIGAAGIVLDVHTGEVLAMVSLPDYDPNDPVDAHLPDHLNRASGGVYELGSVFKSFTFAMALDTGAVAMTDKIDATHGIHFGHFTIDDFHAKHRVLTVPEVFTFSSNVGAAKMALKVGAEKQQEYLRRFGLLTKLNTDIPEVATPMLPGKWSELTVMTVAFGHGIAVTPLQVASADAALMNNGKLIPPTFYPRTREEAEKLAVQVVKPETSEKLRYLFRLNVTSGSGTRAGVPGYLVGGKTGTAEKVVNGRYSATKRLNSFLAAFPMDDPQYAVLIVIDDPQPEKPGAGATAALNAAPVVGNVIRRAAAILGVKPKLNEQDGAIMVSN